MPSAIAQQCSPAYALSKPEPLCLRHAELVEPALARLREGLQEDCLSDYSFSNLFLFRAAHDYHYIPGDYPVIRGRTYDGTTHLLPLFDLNSTPRQVLLSVLGEAQCFFPLAQKHVARLDRGAFACSDRIDDADYLYPAQNFRDYRGGALQKKRNLMRQLLTAHRIETCALTESHTEAALQVLDGWQQDKAKQSGEADQQACIEALRLRAALRLEGFIHYAQGVPIGFVLAQQLGPRVFVMGFAKGRDTHKGIYQFMFHHFCNQLPVDWINFEQDMGHAGLRRAKQSYQPAKLLTKLRVTPRTA